MPTRWRSSLYTLLLLIILCLGTSTEGLQAQDERDEAIEVYLDFRHRGVINSVVISYYKNDQFYLPVSELFSLFNIDHTVNGLTIGGKFGLEQTSYRINFEANLISYGNDIIDLSKDDYILKELDSYLRADLFFDAFGLDFTIDFNNLILRLETDKELPAVEKFIRQQRRQIADGNRYQTTNFELKYGRQRPFLDGGFLDYNLTTYVNPGQTIYNWNTNVGLQFYGGDLQGNLFGSYSDNFNTFSTNNLRWQYRYRDQSWLTRLTIGQTTTSGVTSNNYTGIRLSNEPVEPRRLFDEFEIQGSTIPQSEVELFLNNALIDFQQADELGKYRFLTPVSYGTSQLDLRIYGPTGQIIERSERIQVPFTFQPQGVFNYTLDAGRLDNPLFGSSEQKMTVQGTGAYGLTNWLTAKAGVEYFEGDPDGLPTFTTTLSSRIWTNYLLTIEAVSEAYYRGLLNIIYPNSASLSLDYTDYSDGFSIYNPTTDDKRIIGSIFYPFSLGSLPLNLRLSAFSRIRPMNSTTSLRLDANTRIGKINLRVGYSDRYTGSIDPLVPTEYAFLETSATYNISRNRNLPAYLRGVFLRGQMRYQPVFQQVESAEFLVSQKVFNSGRFQLSLGRNYKANYNNIRFSLIIDFNKVRTGSTYNTIRGSGTFTQNVRGSIAYDSNYHNFLMTSRDQVGRAGTAFKLFVDKNGNGKFDETDDPIKGDAIRVQRSGATSTYKNGILYYTHMQPYYFYNIMMNKTQIPNPMLIPEYDNFGLITDPNRFKQVEVPFYMSGVLEGIVRREKDNGDLLGVAGLKVLLSKKDGEGSKELRTFSDGSFYDYEVPPGSYELRIDPSQLTILKSTSDPEKIEVLVEAKPDGDFIEGLNFTLTPIQEERTEPGRDTTLTNIGVNRTQNNGGGISLEYNISVDSLMAGQCQYGLQIGAYSSQSSARLVAQSLEQGDRSYIVVNSVNGLNMVRAGRFSTLSEATARLRRLADQYPGAAVLDQCSNTPITQQTQGDYRYDLQFAAFSNPGRAQNYIDDLRRQFGLESYSYKDTQSGLYKVRTGPFYSLSEAKQRSQELIRSTTLKDLYITKTEITSSIIDVDFEVELQLGLFESVRKAALYAIRVEESFDLRSRIVVDERNMAVLFLEQNDLSWQEYLSIKEMIGNDNTFQIPTIHLKEVRNTN